MKHKCRVYKRYDYGTPLWYVECTANCLYDTLEYRLWSKWECALVVALYHRMTNA